jgi:hypothetical protein
MGFLGRPDFVRGGIASGIHRAAFEIGQRAQNHFERIERFANFSDRTDIGLEFLNRCAEHLGEQFCVRRPHRNARVQDNTRGFGLELAEVERNS